MKASLVHDPALGGFWIEDVRRGFLGLAISLKSFYIIGIPRRPVKGAAGRIINSKYPKMKMTPSASVSVSVSVSVSTRPSTIDPDTDTDPDTEATIASY
ncbi:MAG: hypothetical protein GX571_11580 [Lentisphaerae bacterium]|nr:hypothetical protein [Lentisphaerota bacterium]